MMFLKEKLDKKVDSIYQEKTITWINKQTVYFQSLMYKRTEDVKVVNPKHGNIY